MSVPQGQRGENKFTLLLKAEELCRYTMIITSNEKVFLPAYQRALTDDIITQAKNAYLLIREANDIRVPEEFPEREQAARDRERDQQLAIRSLRRLLYLIDLAYRIFHLSGKRVKFWSKMVIEVRNRTNSWMKDDHRRYFES